MTPKLTSAPTRAIVILDFGSQYTQLIARRIREQNVFSVVLPCTAPISEINSYSPAGIILSGGPCSVFGDDAPPADERVLELGLPVLGICYGLHFLTHKLGGKMRPAQKREYGHAQVELLNGSPLFKGLPRSLSVWMSHGDEAEELPPGFKLTASSPSARCTSSAATAESTPPLSAQIARPLPTVSFTEAMVSAMNCCALQLGCIWQISKTKLRSSSVPMLVWCTSG